MIRVGLIAAKMVGSITGAGKPGGGVLPVVGAENETEHMNPTPLTAPTTPEEITAAVAAAEKRYRGTHRRKVCLSSPDGCYFERNVESLRQ